jgi:predicted small lipoprotein YifL
MKTISRAITIVSKAFAGCGDLTKLQGPFEFPEHAVDSRVLAAAAAEKASDDSLTTASIVGMWKVQLISKGNTGHNPSIPDGALIDFGFTQWHSDGTEIQNSAGRPRRRLLSGHLGADWVLGIRTQPFSDRVRPYYRKSCQLYQPS